MNDLPVSEFALRARWVLPVDQPPIRDGVVRVAGSTIVAVQPAADTARAHDLGNVALLPGLVNAHTHLEFSGLTRPLGAPGIDLTAWIRQLLVWRTQHDEPSGTAVTQGLRECSARGTTTIGDIVAGDPARSAAQQARADVTFFLETMAFPGDQIDAAMDRIRTALRRLAAELQYARSLSRGPGVSSTPVPGTGSASVHLGISPHAPYTVHPELLDRLVRLSADHDLPVAFHLAESRAELRLLRTGDGPLRDLLVERNLWDRAVLAPGTRPLAYLRRLRHAPRALIIHGNYLDHEELDFLAGYAQRMTLVFCPRSHAFFGHDSYPLPAALARSVRVALGTDSRASNPDLDLLQEMRHVAHTFPAVAPEEIMRMGTLSGAEALGRGSEAGSITPGKHADLVAIAVPGDSLRDPYGEILGGDGPVVATWYQGLPVEPCEPGGLRACQA